jgi:plastocyanin
MRKIILRRPGSYLLRAGCALAWFISMLACFTTQGAIYQVNVYDYFFEPNPLSIQTGDTIEWIAYGFAHAIVSDTRVFDSTTVWNGSIPVLRSFKFTFHEPGEYPYYSLEYGGPEGQGMSGTITVTGQPTNQIPYVPTNRFPNLGDSNQPIRVELRGSAFADGDAGDVHASSQWVVRRAGDNQIIFDSGEVTDNGDTASKTNRLLPGGVLQYGTTYQWQVRYKDSYGAWSPYSASTSFSTVAPPLTGLRGTNAIVLKWPTNSAGFTLESSRNLSSGAWSTVSPPPQVLAGENVVTNSLGDSTRLYRLHKP